MESFSNCWQSLGTSTGLDIWDLADSHTRYLPPHTCVFLLGHQMPFLFAHSMLWKSSPRSPHRYPRSLLHKHHCNCTGLLAFSEQGEQTTTALEDHWLSALFMKLLRATRESDSIDSDWLNTCPKCSHFSTHGKSFPSSITGSGFLTLLLFPEKRMHFVLLLLGFGSVENTVLTLWTWSFPPWEQSCKISAESVEKWLRYRAQSV